jgi:aspartate carbamoyltransferase catalytic subunit
MVTHITKATSLSPERLKQVLQSAGRMDARNSCTMLPNRIVALLFYEASTRTRLSFESATKRLGGNTLTMSEAKQFSSAAKGETLEDTVRVISGYADCIVLRHGSAGAAERAASVSQVPLINAGDGNNEHPTQAYLDIFTILKAYGQKRFTSEGIKILFWGDNENSRTVRSLAKLLVSHGPALGIQIRSIEFFGPNGFGVPPGDVSEALAGACNLMLHTKPPRLEDVDVVYVTRPQRERHQSGKKLEVVPFTLQLAHQLPRRAIIMHPLPRTDELPMEVDGDPRAWYFTQSDHGLLVRMALIWHLLQK